MTATDLLYEIEQIVQRQNFKIQRPISIDTLILVTTLNHDDIMALINELVEKGKIQYYPPSMLLRKYPTRCGTILLIN